MNADPTSQEQHRGEPFRILFVCTGNTCRSPMAEALARRMAEARGWRHVEVRSGGTSAVPGGPASDGAHGAAARRGLDLSAHASSPVTPEIVASSDLILAMTPAHLARVLELGGGGRAHLLAAFAAGDDGGHGASSVPDPFGGSDAEYDETLALLEQLVDATLERLAPLIDP